ncbi:IclR family transcriptional regulator [Dactylosporangium sp. NPDC049525]|uniref:IclR family transcriptional regulator n=1 Tax=Dactylosporangium sp. NPDC049525 TaxID=3154730 RepID=UPI00343F3BD8
MSGSAPQKPGATSSYRGRNATADRALEILSMFGDDRLMVTAADVATHLGVARSSAYRYLLSLKTSGFLQEGDDGFRLGPRIFDIAHLARRSVDFSGIAWPVMRELARRTACSVLLTRRMGRSIVCLEREDGGRPLRLSYERGQVLPVNAGAAALAVLAWTPLAELDQILREPLSQFTEATSTDPEALRSRLAGIRELGYVIGRGELDRDIVGIGAPLTGAGDTVVGALSIAALSHRVDERQAAALARDVVRSAAALSAQLAEAGVQP